MDKQALALELKQVIKTVVDYPTPGIVFRDVTSLMQDGPSFKKVIDAFCQLYADKGITKIVGTESRGFIFGAPLAYALGISFVPVRKPGKLPRQRISQSYQLEYGEDALELHSDAISQGDKVLLVDDLLATGGTIDATVKLVRQLGGVVEDAAFVIALPDLGGVAVPARDVRVGDHVQVQRFVQQAHAARDPHGAVFVVHHRQSGLHHAIAGHEVEAGQGGVEVLAQPGAHPLLDQLRAGQQAQPQPQLAGVFAVGAGFQVEHGGLRARGVHADASGLAGAAWAVARAAACSRASSR